MSEETNHGIEPVVMDNEHGSSEGCATNSRDKVNPVAGCFPKLDGHESLTTSNELPGGSNLVGDVHPCKWRNPLLLDHRKILLVPL